MDKKIIRNFMYNTGYQILTLFLPFITIPYVSRIFSPSNIGIYSSTYSTMQMFLIIGMFAVGSYGVKEIATSRDDREQLSKTFYQIRYLQKITMITSIILYISLFVIFNNGENKLIYLLQSIYLLSGLVDISWLYMGLEDFKKTVTRNLIVKVASLSLIFILVKSPTDLWLYTLILSASAFLGNASMWIYKKNIISSVKLKSRNFKINIIAACSLLIPQLCFQIYTSFDRTILSTVNSMSEVGMFDQSQKIVRMAVGIVTSLSIVMLPRIANMISNKFEKKEINIMLKRSLSITLFIGMGCTFGIYAISDNFVPWFYSGEYLNVNPLLKISSVVCILTALGSFFSNQYAIPKGNKKAYMIPLMVAAIVSIILNLSLGWKLGALGACISIVVAEVVALLLRIYYLKEDLDFKYLFADLYKFIISGVLMVIGIDLIRKIFSLKPKVTSTIIEVTIGIMIYCIILILIDKSYRERIVKKLRQLINKI